MPRIRITVDNAVAAANLLEAIGDNNICPVTGRPVLPDPWNANPDDYRESENIPQAIIDAAEATTGVTVTII